MKIRDKLFLGFGLYMLLAVVLTSFAYRELRTIGTRLSLVETADDITNTILEVRRYEKNFLLYRDDGSLGELEKYLQALKKAINNIRTEIISEIGHDNESMMKRTIDEYERLTRVIAANFTSQEELGALVRQRGQDLEQSLAGPSSRAFLDLRRHEKNVMLDRDLDSYNRFRIALEKSPLGRTPGIREYEGLVAKLHYLYQEEKGSVEAMRVKAREIQSFTENLAKEERSEIATTLRMSVIVLFLALGLILILGTVINFKLAESIVTPIQNLERVTKKIARGDFSETIEVRGHDEISSLAGAFNQMEEKLDHAMTSLDEIIHKLQEKQAQLVEAEKLAAIGKLAAGIAHEINNPLTSVLTFSNLMLEQSPPGDPRHERLKLMARETERARNIVRQLLNFGREIIIKPEKININRPVVEIAESLVAQEAFKGIELDLRPADGLPDVYADPAQIGQVVLNLLLNAIHAITPPGRIGVFTRLNGREVELIVTDSGKGIAEEHLHKIFDPFFTTKAASKGTGLGLAVSYGIIKKHGGDIDVQSEAGKGTTFTVKMPVYG